VDLESADKIRDGRILDINYFQLSGAENAHCNDTEQVTAVA